MPSPEHSPRAAAAGSPAADIGRRQDLPSIGRFIMISGPRGRRQ